MALNTSKSAILDKRRRRVAALRLRGLTQREIVNGLSEADMLNPKTGRPYSVATVNHDLKVIQEGWREEATQDIAEHVARILAELHEVKRAAWSEKAFGDILRAIEKECKILGIDSPDKQIIIEGDLETFLSRLPEEYQDAVRKLIISDFVGSGPARA